ncbi:AraC family transcriptional regulator [Clostridium sp. E02]|uniref:AraC family transcriptional regulator n=1 Tax=Clostridium sp. E02 TaxID=2487134 RepID=UPI000F52EEAE|nr:AraC family transcriptional regulator [Clostridium sp. E02]
MTNTNDTLLYKKKHNITINDIQHSLYYYFDYDERSFDINMPFQHFHSFYEIMILISPQAYHLIEGIPYSIRSGDLVLLRPSILHRSEYPKGPPGKRLVISFLYPPSFWDMPETYHKLFEPFYDSLPIYRFPSKQQQLINEKLNRIYRFSLKDKDSDLKTLIIHGMFVEFLYTLRHLSPYNTYTNEPLKDEPSKKIYTIANYIHNHYSEMLSLDSLSKEFYISPYYLSHQFKDVTGYTLTQYIQMTRIRNVQYLLLNTKKKISELAQECGFTSFSQFNRIFQKYCSQSPSQFRKGGENTSLQTVP